MTKRVVISQNALAIAAAVAAEKGVVIVIEQPDGSRITLTPQSVPTTMDADLINWGPK